MKIKILSRSSPINVSFPLPVFTDDIIFLVIEVLKENFNRQFFWTFIRDLLNLSILSREKQKTIDLKSDFEVLLSYFACLTSSHALSEWVNENEKETLSQKLIPSHQNTPQVKEIFNSLYSKSTDRNFYLFLKSQMTKFDFKQTGKAENEKEVQQSSNKIDSILKQDNFPTNKMQKSVPFLSMKSAKSQVFEILEQIHVDSSDFGDLKIRLFKILHLLNEDLRLSRNFSDLNLKLSHVLYVISEFINVPRAELYRNYYLNLFPQVSLIFKNFGLIKIVKEINNRAPKTDFKPHFVLDSTSFNDQLDPQIFDIIDFLHKIFMQKIDSDKIAERVNRNPYIFKNYYRIIKIVFLLSRKKLECDFFKSVPEKSERMQFSNHPLKIQKNIIFLSIFHSSVNTTNFQILQHLKMLKQIQSLQTKNIVFDQIFLYFLGQKISFNYIESLIDSLTYFYKCVLRLLGKEISKFLFEGYLPKSAYKLLMREDLYANKFLQPLQQMGSFNSMNMSQKTKHVQNDEKQSDVSLQANLLVNPDDNSLNQLSTFILNLQDEKKSQLEPILGPTRHKSASVYSFENSPTDKIIDCHRLLLSKLEKELNISSQSYNHNLHFSKNDAVLSEIYKIFNCTEILIVNKHHYTQIQNYEEFEEEKLNLELNATIHSQICLRLSSFVGKGALDLGTEQISVTDYINIPTINTSGRIKEKEKNFNYLFNLENPSDKSAINWAEFHNGVAAALSISKKSLAKIDKEGLRTWIEYQKTDFSRYDHAGLVYGLGLQGILDCFTIADIYFNLKGGIDARIIGTILGLAIFKNDNFHYMIEETKQKAFCLLLEVNMNDTSQVQISRIVQAASMIGNGIYNKASCKKPLIETMLREIEARPINENNNNRECHSLAAGFALGLINLGKGSNVSSTKDLQIDESLFALIIDGSKGSIFDKNRDSQIPSNKSHSSSWKKIYQASNVKEPSEGNGLLTTPSALIALALIHLKTNNVIVSRRLELPNTIYQIIHGNPLHIFLKVLAKHLIMWKNIKPTNEFLVESIPETVRFLYEKSFSELVKHNLNNKNFDNMDFHNLTIIYFNIVAATLLAISLKNAGTGDESIKELIFTTIKKVQNLEIFTNEFCTTFSYKNKIDAYSYFNLLSILSLNLGIVMAGRCDIESKNLVYSLIKKLKNFERESDQNQLSGFYGFFMAFQMAVGFLYLGNGSLSFGTADFQVACLMMSVYPVFPADFNDNKYHLQALRHFYVLASEERLINKSFQRNRRRNTPTSQTQRRTRVSNIQRRNQTSHKNFSSFPKNKRFMEKNYYKQRGLLQS